MESSNEKARVICNPASRGGGYDPEVLHSELEGYDLEWTTTESPGDATEAAREWRDGLLIVVGGDGTISEVVNGLGRAEFPGGVTLAILPAGTGNDLAATLAIPEDPAEAVAVLRQNRVRTLDVVRVRSEGSGEQFFINVATGGMGAEVSGAADGEMKKRWGKLSYLRASLEVAREYEAKEVTLTLDGDEPKLRAVNLAIGNCRYAGGDWLASPRLDHVRTPYRLRTTDSWIAESLPQRLTRPVRTPTPFSVSTDKLGATAMVGTILLSALSDEFEVSPRQSAAPRAVLEVYPAASLWCWGLRHRNIEVSVTLNRLTRAFGLEIREAGERRLLESRHYFDALIAALTAQEYAAGNTFDPPESVPESTLRVEGWIRVPNHLLDHASDD